MDSLEAAGGYGVTTLDVMMDDDDRASGENGLTGLEAIVLLTGRPSSSFTTQHPILCTVCDHEAS